MDIVHATDIIEIITLLKVYELTICQINLVLLLPSKGDVMENEVANGSEV